jgi:mannose-6-phosphate isomerase-like protein (cupin superfamily)
MKRYFVSESDAPPYSPANHSDTVNRRLIGPENVGAKSIELVLGTIGKGGGAAPHSHPGIEQVCYILEGSARAEVGGEVCEMGPGDSCYFPPGVEHVFTRTSEGPLRVLVIYSPPYGESPDKVRR